MVRAMKSFTRAFALTSLLAACSSDPAPPTGDAATLTDRNLADFPADSTSPEDVTDAVAPPDQAPVDAPADRPGDAAPDVGPDAAPDATPDAAADAAPDATPDVTPDAAPDVAADVQRPDASGDGGCARPDVMPLSGRVDCRTTACPAGYECLSMSGIVLQRFCGIACRGDCDCPAGQSCGSYTDKAGTHPLCVPSGG